MRKKVSVHDLRPGMYVSELDRPWIETPFLFQGFEIHSDDELTELKRQCQYVYIDITQGVDVAPRPRHGGSAARPPVVHAADDDRRLDYEILNRFAATPVPTQPPRYLDRSTLELELQEARTVARETKALVVNIMNDVRLGRSIDTATAKQTVTGLVDSVIRNPDALTCLSQLKHKDEYTAEHSLRVCILALVFGRHLEFTEGELNLLGVGALLHDVGKMKVPTEILNKPGGLSSAEFELMKSHVPRGVEILEGTRNIAPASIEVAQLHHERYDGSGYAAGLAGERISLFGQIGAIVDCYDAITSDRAYHQGLTAHEALRKMYEWRHKDFHDTLIEQFIQCMGIYPIGSIVELSNGSVAVVVTVNRLRRLRPRVALVLTADKQRMTSAKLIDLMQHQGEGGAPKLDILHVLSAGAHGIRPADYLPLGI